MNKTRNLKGIVYKIYNSGASDKVIYLIDTQGRKNVIIAKAIKKQNSKKAYAIDLGNYLEIKVIEGYALPILVETKLIEEFNLWKKDYTRIILLQFFCEIIDKFCLEENQDEKLFSTFYTALSLSNLRVIYIGAIFLLKILYSSGNLPELNQCVVSLTELKTDSIYYSRDYIGYVSDKIINTLESFELVSERIAKTQKYIIENSFQNSLQVILTKEEEIKMLIIEINWIENVIEKALKSKEILLSIIRN